MAPSTLTIIGRYIIQPEIFGHLENQKPGSGNEIQLTDGLDSADRRGPAVSWVARRRAALDCGDKLGYLEANVALGLRHPTLGADFRRILASYRRSPERNPANLKSVIARGRRPAKQSRRR